MSGGTDGWLDGWIDEREDGWMGRWMEGLIRGCKEKGKISIVQRVFELVLRFLMPHVLHLLLDFV